MNIEIQKPELEQRVRARIQDGQFKTFDELLEEALDALDQKVPSTTVRQSRRAAGRKSLVELFAESPLSGLNLDFSRNRSSGRSIDLP